MFTDRMDAGRRLPAELADRGVAADGVIVDDGLATGVTAIACIRRANAEDASHVVLAVPVGSPDTVEVVATEADEVVVLEAPRRFVAIGSHYRDFSQVSDEEAMAYLQG